MALVMTSKNKKRNIPLRSLTKFTNRLIYRSALNVKITIQFAALV